MVETAEREGKRFWGGSGWAKQSTATIQGVNQRTLGFWRYVDGGLERRALDDTLTDSHSLILWLFRAA